MKDEHEEHHARQLQELFPGIQFTPHALQKLESFEGTTPLVDAQHDAFEEWLVETFDRWDPVGLMSWSYSVRHEYAAEARFIRRHIEQCDSAQELAQAISDIFERQFCACLPRDRSTWMAERVYAAWQEYLCE